MKKPVIIVLILAVIVIGAGAYFMTRPSKISSTSTSEKVSTTSPDTNSNGTPAQSNDQTQVSSTVIYTDSGFSPASTTIKSGESVKFVNNSSRALQLDSDPHPTHTNNEELNVGAIGKGESVVVKLTTTGTWNYHNHLRTGDSGTIIVQ